MINNSEAKKIFCYFEKSFLINLYDSIFKDNIDVNFYIYSTDITEDEFKKLRIATYSNIIFIPDTILINNRINLFGLCLLSIENSIVSSEQTFKIINLVKEKNIPIALLQSDILQFETNKKESLKFQNLKLFDKILTFYPFDFIQNASSIGYPFYYNDTIEYQGEYNLIISDINNDFYTHNEIITFYKIMLEFINKTNKIFLLKIAKKNNNIEFEHNIIESFFQYYPNAKERLVFCDQNSMLNIMRTNDLIARSNFVISLMSNAIFDCEQYKKEFAVYLPRNKIININILKKIKTFSDYNELQDITNYNKFIDNFIQEYDNDTFLNNINKLYINDKI